VVERVRTLVVPRELDGAPDLLVGRLLADPVELALQAVQLARELRAAEQRHVAQAAQALAEAQLVLTRGHRTASGASRASAAAPAAARSRRCGRTGGSARPCRSPRGASRG